MARITPPPTSGEIGARVKLWSEDGTEPHIGSRQAKGERYKNLIYEMHISTRMEPERYRTQIQLTDAVRRPVAEQSGEQDQISDLD